MRSLRRLVARLMGLMTRRRSEQRLRGEIDFREALREINFNKHVDWAEVAVAGGYCDQAHLAHEFREFSGFSPSSYLAAERPYENHIRIE